MDLYIYILETENGSFYTGYTNDLESRYRKHVEGKGGRFTRSFRPKRIACAWKFDGDRGSALKVESFIKNKTRKEKEVLIENPGQLKKELKNELQLNLKVKTYVI